MTLELWSAAGQRETLETDPPPAAPGPQEGAWPPPAATPKDQREISMRTGSLDVSENHATCSDTRSNTSPIVAGSQGRKFGSDVEPWLQEGWKFGRGLA